MVKIYEDIDQRTPEWLELRKGKVTGTFAKKVVGTPKAREDAYYELLAERLSVAGTEDDGKSDRDRGIELEDEAVQEFLKRAKKQGRRVGFVEASWSRWAGYSPDYVLGKAGKTYSEDVEVKCLSSKNHVKAWLTGAVPDEYMPQIVWGFVVNDDLETRHVVFYDPRIAVKPYVCVVVERADVEAEIAETRKAAREFISRLEEKISGLTKF